MQNKILVIRHGALGDFFQSFNTFASLRHHYSNHHITLLTSSPYQHLAQISPWFNHVAIDDRPPLWDIKHLHRIHRLLQQHDIIFDLQNSSRTRSYYRFNTNLIWSSSFPHAQMAHSNPQSRHMHGLHCQNSQLHAANILPLPRRVPSWLLQYAPPIHRAYAILVPGAASHRPAKRWPAQRFGTIAKILIQKGIYPIIVGDASQRCLAHAIQKEAPEAYDLTGNTSLPELAGLIGNALFALGNDTGPMHIAAVMNCPGLTLFSHTSDPRRCAPLALSQGHSRSISVPDLALLSTARVEKYLKEWLPSLKKTSLPSFFPLQG